MDISKLLNGFVNIDTLMDFSKLLHEFVKNDIWNFLSCCMDLPKLLHGFVEVVVFLALCQTKPS